MEQDTKIKELNSGTLHILFGEFITTPIIVILILISFFHHFESYEGFVVVYPLYVLFPLFLIYTVSGIFSSFRKIRLFKVNNLQIPISLKILRVSSLILVLIPFIAAFVLLKFILGIPITF